MTTEKNSNIKVEKRRQTVTKDDLVAFKDEINNMITERLDVFINEFFEAWNEAETESKQLTENTEEKCTCSVCSEDLDNAQMDNPARYIIFTGSNKFFATDIKPNAVIGIDFYLHEVDPKTGKEYNSKGTITSADVVVLDLEPDISLEMFSSIKKNTIDYVIQQAHEAQAKDKAMKAEQSKLSPDINHVSYG